MRHAQKWQESAVHYAMLCRARAYMLSTNNTGRRTLMCHVSLDLRATHHKTPYVLPLYLAPGPTYRIPSHCFLITCSASPLSPKTLHAFFAPPRRRATYHRHASGDYERQHHTCKNGFWEERLQGKRQSPTRCGGQSARSLRSHCRSSDPCTGCLCRSGCLGGKTKHPYHRN
jgi:hypothetical protein